MDNYSNLIKEKIKQLKKDLFFECVKKAANRNNVAFKTYNGFKFLDKKVNRIYKTPSNNLIVYYFDGTDQFLAETNLDKIPVESLSELYDIIVEYNEF